MAPCREGFEITKGIPKTAPIILLPLTRVFGGRGVPKTVTMSFHKRYAHRGENICRPSRTASSGTEHTGQAYASRFPAPGKNLHYRMCQADLRPPLDLRLGSPGSQWSPEGQWNCQDLLFPALSPIKPEDDPCRHPWHRRDENVPTEHAILHPRWFIAP